MLSDEREVEITDNQIVLHEDDRRYRVRGLEKNLSLARLHVNVKVDRQDAMHVNSFDLYSDRHRMQFVKRASEELYVEEPVIKRDLARILRKLEELQLEKAQPKAEEPVQLTDAEREAALDLLEDPALLDRILGDYDRCGLVGEEANKLLCYLACVSRRLEQPLAILIQSSSAAGKTTLMDAALAFVPPEDKIKYSAMTGQSLYYMGQTNLKHKVLAIAEEEGVQQASYALKLLQSEGKLTLASTEKDSETGRQQTPQQTAAIHARQRQAYTLSGHADVGNVRQLHQNAQRLLLPVKVVIPWTDKLTFRNDQTRMRRDHVKYLSLIASLALLHQYQREQRDSCVVASKEDIEVANRLTSEALGKSLDSLMPQTRQLLTLLDEYVPRKDRSEARFTQRELRERLGWGDFQLRRHLKRLVELEYVIPHNAKRNQKEYELLYQGEGQGGELFLLGLVDASTLRKRKTIS